MAINGVNQSMQAEEVLYTSEASAQESAKSEDTRAQDELNGGANWGNTDGYTPSKTSKKSDAKIKIGPTQEELDKKRADLKKSIAQNKAKGGFKGYFNAFRDAIKYKNTPKTAGVVEANSGAIAKFIAVTAGAVALVASVSSCEQQEIEQTNPIDFPTILPTRPVENDFEKFKHYYYNAANKILDGYAKSAKTPEEFTSKVFEAVDYDIQNVKFFNDAMAYDNEKLTAIKSKIESENKDADESLDVQAQIMKALAEAKYYYQK